MLDPSDIPSTVRTCALAAVVALVAAAIYVVPALDTPFYTKGEAREAVLVQAMVETGNGVLPLRNGNEIPSKPPLFHWLGVLASAMTGGVTELSTRIPSVLAAAVALGATAWIGQRCFGLFAGIVAAVILGSSVTFFVSATTARVDMVLVAAINVALAIFHADYVGARRGLSHGFHAAAAIGVLAKGPVGVVLPWAVVVVVLLCFRDRDYAGRLRPSIAFRWLLVPALWYAAAFLLAGDGFVMKQLVQENFQRLVDAEGGATGHVKPFYAHLPLLLGGLAPWSLLAPVAIGYALRDAWTTRSRSLVIVLASVFVPLVILSFAGSKRAVYMLPSYPAVALAVGWWWTRPHGFTNEAITRASRLWAALVSATAAIMALPLVVLLLQSTGLPIHRAISPLMSEGDAANLEAIARSLAAGRVAVLPGVLVALGLTAGLLASARRQQRRHAVAVAGLLAALTIVGGSLTLQRAIARTQTVAPFVRAVAFVAPPGAEWGYFRGVSYPVAFYARRPVPELASPNDLDSSRSAIVFAAAGDLEALAAAGAESGRRVTELGRFTFADNPARAALVAALLAPTGSPPPNAS